MIDPYDKVETSAFASGEVIDRLITETEIMYTDPGDEAQQAFGANAINGIASNNVGEAPPPPAPLANGDSKVKQLSSLPGGDESPSVVKAEGLMDVSESPLSG